MFAAVLALTATTTFTASAQEDPVTPTTEVTAPSTPAETTAPSTPDETPVTETPVTETPVTETPVTETPATETPADKPADKPADAPADTPAGKPEEKAGEKPADQEQQQNPVAQADMKASAEVVGSGPFLVGQTVTVKLTVTNTSAVEATGVYAYQDHQSGPYYGVDLESWGDLRGTTKFAAGETRTYTLTGKPQTYVAPGISKFMIRVYAANDANPYEGHATIEFAVRETVKTGTISGVLWGDANGNGVQDAGEGLAGARVYANAGWNPNGDPSTRTDANGRFTLADLELRVWSLNFTELPGGWVLTPGNNYQNVDGTGATSNLRFQAVRPLTDQLSASARIIATDPVPGGSATVEITLSNRGGADVVDVVEGCNRAGMGPHLTFPNGLSDLDWNKGATIPAGQTRVFTAAAVIPENADVYGYAFIGCDFGPRDGILDGFPGVFEYVQVGDRRTDTNGSVYVDRDGNGWMNDAEHLTGVSISLVDPKTGAVVATATTTDDEFGRAFFTDIPVGLYRPVVEGPWKLKHPEWFINAASCPEWCNYGWAVEVVPADEPGGTPGGGDSQPETPEPAKVVQVDTFRPTATASPLAQTGASVEGLALAGALTLLLGGASIFLARRRTA
ncbi:hypothetical protein Lesp01_18240 [Lentzea sp. NBRC 102530]|nr:hypothetical protein Lesp01_18240 [Lentzea sp. NBRC 102530]